MDLRNSEISFWMKPMVVFYQDDSVSSIPVSMGAVAGLSYRMEDRMFYNKTLQFPQEKFGEVRPS